MFGISLQATIRIMLNKLLSFKRSIQEGHSVETARKEPCSQRSYADEEDCKSDQGILGQHGTNKALI